MNPIEKEIIIRTLKRVLEFGIATNTYINVTNYLDELDIPRTEYKTWYRGGGCEGNHRYNQE